MRDVARAPGEGVESDQGEADRDHRDGGEREAGDGDAAAQAEQREGRKPRRVDDQAAPVGAQTAPADDDERGERDHREQRQFDERPERKRRGEQERLHLVREPEETPAAFGMRAERRERTPCSTWSAEAIVEASTSAGIASSPAPPKNGERRSQANAAKPKTRPIRTRVLSLRAKCAAFRRAFICSS